MKRRRVDKLDRDIDPAKLQPALTAVLTLLHGSYQGNAQHGVLSASASDMHRILADLNRGELYLVIVMLGCYVLQGVYADLTGPDDVDTWLRALGALGVTPTEHPPHQSG